jgi:hypothetical protein
MTNATEFGLAGHARQTTLASGVAIEFVCVQALRTRNALIRNVETKK